MARSTNLALGLGLPVLLLALYGGAHVVFYETYRNVSFTEVAYDPVLFAGDLPSYITPEEFQRRVAAMGSGEVSVKDEQTSESDPGRPPFKHTFMDVHGFTDIGFTGTLTAHFFNDRLAEVWFQAPNVHDYYDQLLHQRGIPSNEPRELRHGHLIIRLAMGPTGAPRVYMEDERLTDEMKLWIKRYS
ncbi:MAG TPA: hypothetical protein VEC57_09775 [Candidatus Limnocylindrales bacterium]|nr:hypothetical protein [Candidatus Limnocylindrales bacterium]